jgi:hypothetical protein
MMTGAGPIGSQFWRARQISASLNDEWQVDEIAFFSTKDGAANGGSAITGGTAIAKSTFRPSCSADYTTCTQEDIDVARQLRQDELTKNLPAEAMDGDESTHWRAEDKSNGQWIGVDFGDGNAQEVQSVTIKTTSASTSPPQFIIEKSTDGLEWARVMEFTDPKAWYDAAETYSWRSLDSVPPSVFAIRSQLNPLMCIGVKETPDANDPENGAPTPIMTGASLEIQLCDDMRTPQWWSFDQVRGLIHNAADMEWILDVNATLLPDGTTGPFPNYLIGECPPCDKNVNPSCTSCVTRGYERNPDAAPFGATTDLPQDVNNFEYLEGDDGGLLKLKNGVTKPASEGGGQVHLDLILSPENADVNSIAVGDLVTLVSCGGDETTSGDIPVNIEKCPTLKHAQWELLLMFNMEENKKAVNCAPYSHSHAAPILAETKQDAQRACAADIDCAVYNWDSGATKTAHVHWRQRDTRC